MGNQSLAFRVGVRSLSLAGRSGRVASAPGSDLYPVAPAPGSDRGPSLALRVRIGVA